MEKLEGDRKKNGAAGAGFATIEDTVRRILPLHADAMVACKARMAELAKPVYGLGKLEDLFMQFAGIQRTADVEIQKKALVVFLADHGVCAEGVSQTDRHTTAAVANALANGTGLIQLMARRTDVDVVPVDIGIAEDTVLPDHKIRRGTADFLHGSAMTREEAERAVMLGVNTAWELKRQGYQLLGAGEMGVGGTTAASAVTACMLRTDADDVTWKGSGLSAEGLKKKRSVVAEAIRLHAPDPKDPIDILSKVGGLEIAGMAGLFLGGAALGMPVAIDDFPSAAAAFLASRYSYLIRSYAFPSHRPKEPGAVKLLERMQMYPPLELDYNVGQGVGALSLFSLLSMMQEAYDRMGTFADLGIEPYPVRGCH